jgi:hypothetical protein
MLLTLDTPPSWFAHVPKTGGISLGSVIEGAYRTRDRLQLIPPNLATLSISELRRFRCFHDFHHGRSMLQLTGRSDLIVFTMLREPIERTISQIQYLQHIAAEIPHTFTPEYLAAVKPILQSDLSRPLDLHALALACDSQVGMLGVLRDYRPLFKGSPDADSGRSVLRPFPLRLLSEDEYAPESLTRAKEWLAEMDVVGIHEHFAESTQLVCSRLGIPTPSALPRANRNPTRSSMSERYRSQLPNIVVDQIEEFTRRDRELYAFACTLFQEQRARHLARPSRHFSLAPRVRRLGRTLIEGARNTRRRMVHA